MPRPEEEPDLLIVKHPGGSFLVDPDEDERDFSEICRRSVPAQVPPPRAQPGRLSFFRYNFKVIL